MKRPDPTGLTREDPDLGWSSPLTAQELPLFVLHLEDAFKPEAFLLIHNHQGQDFPSRPCCGVTYKAPEGFLPFLGATQTSLCEGRHCVNVCPLESARCPMPRRPFLSTHLLEVVDHGRKRLCQEQHQNHRLLQPAFRSILPKDRDPAGRGGGSAGAQHL